MPLTITEIIDGMIFIMRDDDQSRQVRQFNYELNVTRGVLE